MTRTTRMPAFAFALLSILLAVPAPASAEKGGCVPVSEYESFCVLFGNCAGFAYVVSNGQVSRGFSKGVCLDNGVEYCEAQWDVDGTREEHCSGIVLPA